MDTPELSRRAFLGTTAAGALVLGFPWLASGEDAKPEAWTQALEAMKKRKCPGVAIVVPEGADDRKKLGAALERIAKASNAWDAMPALAPLLLEAVWVCVPAKTVEAKDGETVVLVDSEGKRVAGAKIDLSDDAKVEKDLADLLHGEERLAKRAKEQRTKEVEAALAKVAGNDDGTGIQYLAQHLDAAIAAIIEAIDAAKGGKSAAPLKQLLASEYARRVEDAKSFPYGVEFKVEWNQPAPCPPCGEARPSVTARKFLDFLTK
jgi:hypothetical protein